MQEERRNESIDWKVRHKALTCIRRGRVTSVCACLFQSARTRTCAGTGY